MDERAEIDRLRAERVADELAILKQQRRMTRAERELERDEQELANAEERAKADIEEELRREHLGHESERPPAWPTSADGR